jgi:serine/threonine protein kinase
MEYLPYPDLSTWRNQPGYHYFTGTDKDTYRIIRDMASALGYLVDQQILHNDIKPGNIIYDHNRGFCATGSCKSFETRLSSDMERGRLLGKGVNWPGAQPAQIV